jgi:hypothetical protein
VEYAWKILTLMTKEVTGEWDNAGGVYKVGASARGGNGSGYGPGPYV